MTGSAAAATPGEFGPGDPAGPAIGGGYLRRQWAEAGLLEFEFADDTASDFEAYDAVAADRSTAPLS